MASDVVGLAIGRNGNNIKKVKKLDGILSVEFDQDKKIFCVRGKVSEPTTYMYMYFHTYLVTMFVCITVFWFVLQTPDVLTRAKELLEFVKETVIKMAGESTHVAIQVYTYTHTQPANVMMRSPSYSLLLPFSLCLYFFTFSPPPFPVFLTILCLSYY